MSPWLSIWVKPRKTIRAILSENPNYHLGILSAIYGLHYLFYSSQFLSLAIVAPAWLITVVSLVFALPVGYIVFNLTSFFIFLLGKLLGGNGCFKHIRSAFAWCAVPYAISLILWFIVIGFFGDPVFMLAFPGTTPAHHLLLFQVCLLLQMGIGLWALVLLVNALAEVQRYSVWMSLLNLIMASIIMGLIFYGVGFAIERL